MKPYAECARSERSFKKWNVPALVGSASAPALALLAQATRMENGGDSLITHRHWYDRKARRGQLGCLTRRAARSVTVLAASSEMKDKRSRMRDGIRSNPSSFICPDPQSIGPTRLRSGLGCQPADSVTDTLPGRPEMNRLIGAPTASAAHKKYTTPKVHRRESRRATRLVVRAAV